MRDILLLRRMDLMAWSTRRLAQLGVTTVKTLRHYHDIGLLEQPERAAAPCPRGGVLPEQTDHRCQVPGDGRDPEVPRGQHRICGEHRAGFGPSLRAVRGRVGEAGETGERLGTIRCLLPGVPAVRGDGLQILEQPCPAGEPVITGHDELRLMQRERRGVHGDISGRALGHSCECLRAPGADGALEGSGLAAQMIGFG